ncbi:AAA family ATPase [Chromobacterium haemolyticum]|uniref:AAA family ATPase n=1 Tax=Chromobacterium haemolyticum TaxID=394935 RepID=A0ABS3GKD6_9NEIS|nr:AAA family ATPase [Chromobacterium haemolyticum]MBK0414136.1 AAA family ATPase [Chromobacterium haemolyticum]MBO0415515.1 AAA family ATPase [Chromobacterium haemolyticum]MBO0498969.1 AAA family ATPase [Chromobacterium haemolyticum]
MPIVISMFNNKGGVGKTTLTWNVADALGRSGKRILLIDFDPQCNLSIAMMGEDTFVDELPTQNSPYGKTIRSYLQRFLQNIGGEEVFTHKGRKTSPNVDLIAGDFWLNVYADSLNVGADLLSGTGLSKYIVLSNLIAKVEEKKSVKYDYVLIDLPPSFGALVRAAMYSSDYFIVPCTSDNFSAYCVGLIGQMIPSFVRDWETGLSRFKEANAHFSGFDKFGKPKFAGWIFNGFDTARKRRTQKEISQGVGLKEKRMHQADQTLHDRMVDAINDDLIGVLNSKINNYTPTAQFKKGATRIGDIEDANVLMQNSLWLNTPLATLEDEEQVVYLRDRQAWAENQIEQIQLLREKFNEIASNIIRLCK